MPISKSKRRVSRIGRTSPIIGVAAKKKRVTNRSGAFCVYVGRTLLSAKSLL